MKTSKIYLISWMLIGLVLLISNLIFGVTWVLSGFLLELCGMQEKKESKKQKEVPPYVD